MDIYVVSEYYYPDNFKVNDMVREFVQRGHNVTTLAGLPDYETGTVRKEYRFFRRRKETVDGAKVVRVSTVSRRTGAFFRILTYSSFAFNGFIHTKLCRKPSCDVIFVNQITPILQAIPALSLGKRIKKPVVLYCMDIWPEVLKAWDIKESSLFFRCAMALSKKLYRKCDLILISSKPFREYLTKVIGVDGERIVYLPQYAEDLYENIAGKYLENGVVDFLFAGNIGSVQDIECIIKAVKHIEDNNLNNGKEYKVHIVGDGINLENCKNLTKELDVVNQVVFHGRHPLSEMKRFYEMADCFLLTMRGGDFISMTLPGKAQSYLSVGKPIAGAIDGAAMEVINEADCGLCVRGSDHEGLASIMAQIMLDFETYKEKGHNGRKYYLDNFTKDSFFDSLFDIFVDLQESLR